MKKFFLILLTIIIILIIILFGIYVYASSKNRQTYISKFERCKELMSTPQVKEELAFFPQAQECIDAGGCFETCGSGCGLPKPTINLLEMIDFYLVYFSGRSRNTVCANCCLYPVK